MADPSFAGSRDDRRTELFLSVERGLIPRLYRILQGGFLVEARLGTSVGYLLRDQLALSPQYVMDRISTIFLDGKPVDDVDGATIKEGSTLALSSAMPGLVGASFRRQGFYASFRRTITHGVDYFDKGEKEGLLRVKVFNLLIADLGPLFLERGIYVLTRELEDFLAAEPDRFFDGIQESVLDGQPAPPSLLRRRGAMAGCGWTHLTVCTLR